MPKENDRTGRVSEEMLRYQAQERLAEQYVQVFGRPPDPGKSDTRTDAQKAVWSDLEKVGLLRLPIFQEDARGVLCPTRAAINDGKRYVIHYLMAQLAPARPPPSPQ